MYIYIYIYIYDLLKSVKDNSSDSSMNQDKEF